MRLGRRSSAGLNLVPVLHNGRPASSPAIIKSGRSEGSNQRGLPSIYISYHGNADVARRQSLVERTGFGVFLLGRYRQTVHPLQ